MADDLETEADSQGLAALVRAIKTLPGLRLRGLMAIPEARENIELLHQRFALLRELLEQLNAEGMQLDVLSMGMSDDFEIAISEGATILRIGTAIFGERTKKGSP